MRDTLTTLTHPTRMKQLCTEHLGIVRCVDDPLGTGRVLVECPSVFGTDAENWVGWCDFAGMPTGSQHKKGDMGIWWPPVPGLLVNVAFESGSKKKPYCYPAGAWADGGKPYIPEDAAAQGNKKALHVRVLKSEAGHSIVMDDNGKQEAMFVCDWTGAGWFSMSPGQVEDAKSSSPCSASRMRKGKMRGGASVFNGSAPKPSEIIDGGVQVLGHLDLNGQGFFTVAKDGNGSVILFAANEAGKIGPSIILDAKDNRILLTAGSTQLVVNGKKGHVEVTRQIILESALVIVNETIKAIYDAMKDFFKKFKGGDSGGSGGGSGSSGGGGGTSA